MPVDTSIPLAAGNFQPASAQTMMSMAAMSQQFQNAQRAQDAQNKLRELYQDPDNVDDQGNLKQNALTQVMQVDPNMGMQINQNQLRTQQARAQMQMLSSDTFKKQMEMGNDVLLQAHGAYESALKNGMQEPQAREAGQKVLDDGVQGMRSSGAIPEQLMRNFKTQFDPNNYPMYSQKYLSWQKMVQDIKQKDITNRRDDAYLGLAAKDTTNREMNTALRNAEMHRPDWEVLNDPGNHNTPYRLDKNSGTTVTLSGQPYTPQGAAKLPSGGSAVPKNPTQAATEAYLREHPDASSEDLAKFNQTLKSGGTMGGREAVMLGRVMTAAQDTMKDIGNIMELPTTSSTGWFGGSKQGPSLYDAVKANLANSVTSQEVQDFNVHTVGLGRAMASIESMGLAPSQHFQDQFDRLMLKEGDSMLTKMRKVSSIRQQVESGIDTALASPRLSDDQRKLLQDAKSNIERSVPFTPHDVTELERSKDPKATLRQFATSKGLGGGEGEQKKASEGGKSPFPEFPDAKQAPNGKWYVNKDGKWYPVIEK